MDTVTAAAPAGTGAAGAARPYRLRWVVAGVVLAANVVDLLDATIVNVAAPSIHNDLGGGTTTIQWLSAGYTLGHLVGTAYWGARDYLSEVVYPYWLD